MSGCAARSLTERAADLSKRRANRVAQLGDLLVGQGAIRGAELEAERQALAPLADLLAVVEVEDAGVAQELADLAKVESDARLEGKAMTMILTPK